MKHLFTILLVLISLNGWGQDSSLKCPIGEKYFPGISGDVGIASGCWPDSLLDKAFKWLAKKECEGNGAFEGGGTLAHSLSGKWVNDSIGCKVTEYWEKKINDSWIKVSHKEYSDLCKCEWTVNKNNEWIQVWDGKKGFIK